MNCQSCQADNPAAARFCVRCGTALVPDTRVRGAPSPAPSAVPSAYAPYAPPALAAKSPAIAAVLSLVVAGLGQFYNGDAKKGAVMLFVAVLLAGPTVGLGWLAVIVWSAVDAYQVAEGRGRRWS